MADQRRVFGKDIADLLGNSAIDLEPRFDENQLRAFMSRRHRRHGRPDTEFAGLVACRGDHTTSSRSPDSEGLTEQFRIVKHRAEHSVEENGSAILEENTTSVASRRTMEVIAAGKGRKPKPFMLDATEADAVWDSSHGLAADERMAAKKGGTRSEKGRTHQAIGIQTMPKPADAAMPTRQDLEPSPALSIVQGGPKRFEGRKLGVLVTDGVDAKLLKKLMMVIEKEKALVELIAPKIGGVTASDGTWIEAQHMIDGGPSVLFDAVAVLAAPGAVEDLVKEATARDFVADAFQHCKFIGYDESAFPLLVKAGITDDLDEGTIALPGEGGVAAFVSELGKLRVWGREPALKLGKASPPVD